MELIDDAASCDEPVRSSNLAEPIVELVDEKLTSDAASAEATNVRGNDEVMRKIASESVGKLRAQRAQSPLILAGGARTPKSGRFRLRLT